MISNTFHKFNIDTLQTSSENKKKFTPYDPSQEPIFPPELKVNHTDYSSASIKFGKDLNTVSIISKVSFDWVILLLFQPSTNTFNFRV